MAVEHQVERIVGEGQGPVGGGRLEVDAQGQQSLPAQLHVGGIVFNGGRQMMGMVQRQQKFAAAGVHVQDPAVGPQGGQHLCPIIPGQSLFIFPASLQMGKIPAVDVGDGLFGQPLFS